MNERNEEKRGKVVEVRGKNGWRSRRSERKGWVEKLEQ